jgi:hypothetical protein
MTVKFERGPGSSLQIKEQSPSKLWPCKGVYSISDISFSSKVYSLMLDLNSYSFVSDRNLSAEGFTRAAVSMQEELSILLTTSWHKLHTSLHWQRTRALKECSLDQSVTLQRCVADQMWERLWRPRLR